MTHGLETLPRLVEGFTLTKPGKTWVWAVLFLEIFFHISLSLAQFSLNAAGG